MTIRIIRGMFALCCMIMGVFWADYLVGEFGAESTIPLALWRLAGGASGCGIAVLVLFSLRFITQDLYERLFPVVIAITLSLVMGYFLARYIVIVKGIEDLTSQVYLTTSMVLVFGFVGISVGLTKASNWASLVSAVKQRHPHFGNPKLVDTSVIIDGRISGIIEAGFIEGTLIIPRFVLKELQNIADSEDLLRRTKGRRGLDILKEIQNETSKVEVQIVDDDPEQIREVDSKLVALAIDFKAKILTNDYNLNKVAQIEGVEVMNINDLSNAVKPAALPDENLEVKIIKEGKESYQGVGYLDDGTMIVVDGGREHVGKKVSVIVTSVLQTAAGRMIFTKLESVLQ